MVETGQFETKYTGDRVIALKSKYTLAGFLLEG